MAKWGKPKKGGKNPHRNTPREQLETMVKNLQAEAAAWRMKTKTMVALAYLEGFGEAKEAAAKITEGIGGFNDPDVGIPFANKIRELEPKAGKSDET